MKEKIMLPIKKAVIEICGICNYKCKMCPHAFGSGREQQFKRMMNYQMFLNLLEQLEDSHVEEIFLEGSGEPTMNKRLPDFVRAASDKGFRVSYITNGALMTGNLMQEVVDAGLHFTRFSVTGYNKQKYTEWMSEDNLELIISNANETLEYIRKTGAKTTVGSYHLIIDNNNVEYEVEQYQENFINKVPGIKASIWMMHNWAGLYSDITYRTKPERRSCGRPFSPDLVVRAGGNDGKQGAVVPCCMVLGQDSTAVLGHLSEQTVVEIWNGEKYQALRSAHREHRFDDIPYCKNCDMLYEAPESLVWSNFDTSYHQLTGGLFDMREFRI